MTDKQQKICVIKRLVNILGQICGERQLGFVAENAGKFLFSGELSDDFGNMVVLQPVLQGFGDGCVRLAVAVADEGVVMHENLPEKP